MMLRIAKKQVHRSLAAMGYRLVRNEALTNEALHADLPAGQDEALAHQGRLRRLLEEARVREARLSELADAAIAERNAALAQLAASPLRIDPERIADLKSAASDRPIPPKMLDPKYPGVEDIPLYLKRYGVDSLLNRRFYNIGAAWNKHACWTMVDHPSAWYAGDQENNLDLKWDISKLGPIDVETGTAEAVYSSHTVEHLLDPHVAHMFAEAYRILKPGGFFRVTCPNIALFYDAYARRDDHVMLYGDLRPAFSHQQIFLNEFASQLTEIMKQGNPEGGRADIRIADAEVDRVFADGPTDAAFNHFTGMIDYELQKVTVGAHINWWTHEKVERFMRQAGFTKIRQSAHKQSACAAMRGKEFDTTHIAFSLYVEAER